MAEQTPRLIVGEDKRSFDMRALWRLALWGTAASGCLVAVVLAAQTNTGTERLLAALSPPIATAPIATAPITPTPSINQPSTAQLAARSAETEKETRRLAQAVQTLDADRDRLLTRIAALEHGLDDITGSIRRQAAEPAPASAQAPPATVAAKPPEPAEAQPEPAMRNVAAATAGDTAEVKPAQPQIGIDVGGSPNFDGLRLLWNATRSVHAPWFEELHPLAMARENPRNHAVELRLVVGPFADAEAASAVCAALTGVRRFCKPATYEGQPFSLVERESKPPAPTRRPAAPAAKAGPPSPPHPSL